MKFVPNAIARKVADQALLGRKHSPTLLFGAGVVGMVGSTVLACRATLKLSDIVENTREDHLIANSINDERYSEADRRKDITIIYFRGITRVARIYAPSVLLGAASVGCLTKSHNILQERNLALTAAYAAVDEAFKSYRGRVIEKYGEEEDRLLRYESQEVDIVDEDTGEVTSTVRVADGGHSMYARWFDEESLNWNRGDNGHQYNVLFLQTQQNWANDLLRARGHVFLNEVYNMLGLEHTSAGSVVGWVFDRERPEGDNYIDFGIWDNADELRDFNNGREGAILLDFNVDGIIWDKIDKHNNRRKS